MMDILTKPRKIAVAWIENYEPAGGYEIMQKHKLASDIQECAKELAVDFGVWLRAYTEKDTIEMFDKFIKQLSE